jgi:hypothetical protein
MATCGDRPAPAARDLLFEASFGDSVYCFRSAGVLAGRLITA